jgi:3-isopropylmalate/(R)-2-methylmalate dehydratase small subunit
MTPFTTLTATAAYYARPNVDTDLIIRVERCAQVARHELGPYAFEMVRYRTDGSENPDFVLNRAPWRDTRILVGAENFGCGSSREMAVWALAGMGIRCVIAPSFGQIFFDNCFQNGVLAIRLPAEAHAALATRAADPQACTFSIDLAAQVINGTIPFDVDPLRKKMLLEGLDEIGLTLAREAEIAAFQQRDRAARLWVYVPGG